MRAVDSPKASGTAVRRQRGRRAALSGTTGAAWPERAAERASRTGASCAAADVLGPGQAVARVPLPPASPVDPELAIDLGPGFPANQDPRRGPRTGAPAKTRVASRWCALPGPAWEARLEPSLESGRCRQQVPIVARCRCATHRGGVGEGLPVLQRFADVEGYRALLWQAVCRLFKHVGSLQNAAGQVGFIWYSTPLSYIAAAVTR